jgi:hypothetical protein
LLAAIAYFACAVVFVIHAHFEYAWWLNMGNMLFMAILFIYGWKQKTVLPSASGKITAGILVTLWGVVSSCIFIVLASCFHLPHLKNTPDVAAKSNSLFWILFINTIVVNFCCGAFITLMMAYAFQQKDIGNPS